MRVIKERDVILVKMDDENTHVFDKRCIDNKEFECSVFNKNGIVKNCQRMCAEGTGVKFCKGDYRE